MIVQKYKSHIKELFSHKGIQKSLTWILGYGLWCWIAPTLFLTFMMVLLLQINYWTLGQSTSLKNLSDYYKQFELVFLGLSSIGFVLFLKSLSPLVQLEVKKVFFTIPLSHFYWVGLFQGIFYGALVVFAFIYSNVYQYLGFLLSYENFNLFLFDFLFNFFCLFFLIHIEEYLFRGEIQRNLQKYFSPGWSYLITSLFYVMTKEIQFDLYWIESINIFFISIILCLLYDKYKNYAYGSGLYFGLFASFQFIFSLPIFGREFNSFVRVTLSENNIFKSMDSQKMLDLISGGELGPLASLTVLCLCLLLIFQQILSLYLQKKYRN